MAAKDLFGSRKPRNPKAERAARPLRQPAPRILLVCEGEKTEPIYFSDLVVAWGLSNQVKIGKNDGSSPDRIVARAEELFALAQREGDAFDEVFCVFDRDAHERFGDAVARLKALKAVGQPVSGVVSVPCFEFWLLLLQGLSEMIKRLAFLQGLIEDPTAKKAEKTAEEELVESIRRLAEAGKAKQAN